MQSLTTKEILERIDKVRDSEIYNLIKDENLDGKTLLAMHEKDIETLYNFKLEQAVIQFHILKHSLRQSQMTQRVKVLGNAALNNKNEPEKELENIIIYKVNVNKPPESPSEFKFPNNRLNLTTQLILMDPNEKLNPSCIIDIINALFNELISFDIKSPTTDQFKTASKSLSNEYPHLRDFNYEIRDHNRVREVDIDEFILYKLKTKFYNQRYRLTKSSSQPKAVKYDII